MRSSLGVEALRGIAQHTAGAAVRARRGRPDPWMVVAVALLLGIGWVFVLNATYFRAATQGDPLLFARRHTISLVTGVVLAFVASRIRTEVWQRSARFLLVLTVALLLLVLIPGIGQERGGARRWLAYGSLTFQPAEMAKLTLTLFLARFLSLRPGGARDLVIDILPPLIVTGLVCAVVVVQPDLGTSAILAVTTLGLLFVAGAPRWVIGALVVVGGVALALAVWIEPYRMKRALCFIALDEDRLGDCFQLMQSLLAFGVGGWWGVGPGGSLQKLFYLPEAHTDFIFALVGEETGLLGVGIVIALFLLLAVKGFRIVEREADPFARYLAFGLTLSLTLEAIVHMGVTLGLWLTKGLVLPLVSYGGSALWFSLVRVGILLNLSRRTS